MNGVDAIAFTAGLGENNAMVRGKILSHFGYLGVKVDDAKNEKAAGVESVISADDSKVICLAVPTNEELAICRETVALVK